ncbi:MAG: (2Fe-2S) ferredoxin domain-containing protein, partial [bacterium]|nr:(2Fe-2S) ferredoxin domain-containing protein [bacterium]
MKKMIVGMGRCGWADGAQPVYDKLQELVEANPEASILSGTGCIGMCFREPLVEVQDGDSRVIYGNVTAKSVEAIFESHIIGGTRVEDENLVYLVEGDGSTGGNDANYLDLQDRIVLRNCGLIDP